MSTIDLNKGCFVYINFQWAKHDIINFRFFNSVLNTLSNSVAIIPLAQILAQSTSHLNLRARGSFQSQRLVLRKN